MDQQALWQGFVSPPDSARPRAWWHWMDGNIELDGITLDLEWLHRVGVRGVQLFDGAMGTPLVVPQRVVHASPEWRAAVLHAASTAQRLGLELAVATSAGWSAAGGPWVEPQEAMKKVVWSEVCIQGGGPIEHLLPELPDVAGPYQDCPRWRADPGADRFAEGWVVIAFPADDSHDALVPAEVRASSTVGDWSCLVDGSFAGAVTLERDPDGPSRAWIEQSFDEPVTCSSVTVGLPGPGGFGAPPPAHAVLESSDDGVAYETVADVPELVIPAGKSVGVRTVSFPPVTARRFRLVLTGGSAASGLPRLAPGVRLPPVLRRVSGFFVSEFALHAGGRVHYAELKAGFAAAPDYFALDTDPAMRTVAIDPDQVVDVTRHVDEHGLFRWDAPPGRWRILRLGASLTGQRNGPAPPEATGLEVDKLDATNVRRYLNTYLATFDAVLSEDPAVRIDALLSDSIESGPQNFTHGLRERFSELRGYDPLPWLAALAGYVVDSASRTDRFLWDYRRTIADLLASEYYGTIEQEAHARGLTYYAEALEDNRPQLGDDLAMRSHADVPMGAMWVFDLGAGTGAPNPTYVADLKGASSVAHVYGKEFTGAESMTAFHRPWSETPRRLKHVADLELALGVTRFCIHTSPHQPVSVPPPGIALSPHLGQAFVRTEPWAEMAGPWIDYLARCSWLLNQGVPAVDVAVFVGEEAPLTGLFGRELDRLMPVGFDFDYVNLDVLEERVTVVDGALVAGDARYRVLALGGSSERMTVRALRRIATLVDEGAIVVGPRPTGSPSLADDDREHERLCDLLWKAPAGYRRGRVLGTRDLAAALVELGVTPDLVVDGAHVLRIGRRTELGQLVFVANPSTEPASVTLRASSARALVAWDPVTLQRAALPESGARSLERPGYRLDLPPCGSVFVVEGGEADAPTGAGSVERPLDGWWQVSIPGVVEERFPDGPRPWTELGDAGAGFGGIGTYTAEFDVGPEILDARTSLLDLGEVGDIARVQVNGLDCGIAWTPPWQVDVTTALRPGANDLVIDVANAWMNRLIAEASVPTGRVFAPAAEVYMADAPIRAAGLAGPVRLLFSD